MNIVFPFTKIIIANKTKLLLEKMMWIRSSSKVEVWKGAKIKIDSNMSINHDCMVVNHQKVIAGKGVQFRSNVLVYDHDFRVKK